MTAADVMTRDVKTCRPNDSLAEAARIMWNKDCGVVPVTDGTGHLTGMVTDRDICMAALAHRKPLEAIQISAAMTGAVRTCREDDDAAEVEARMASERVRRLPVVDAAKRIVGIVSINDLALHALTSGNDRERLAVASTFGEICRHRDIAVV